MTHAPHRHQDHRHRPGHRHLHATPPGAGCRPSGPRPRARGDLGSEPVERLEAEVIDLSARLAAGTSELLVLVGELDHRGSWATWGALSCAAWLADCCDIDVGTARTQVRVARAMRQFPTLDQAMAAGDVSYAKARVLAAYLTEANVDALLAIAAWSQRNDDPDTIRRRQHEARSVSDRAVTALLPEAFVSLLLHDNQGRPIEASPGCHATTFLQYDHIQPYAEGGPTVLANLRRLCGPHNRARSGAARPPERTR